MNFKITNDTVTVVVEGKVITVREGAANYHPLVRALLDKRWSDVPNHLTANKSLADWVSCMPGFTVSEDGKLSYGGTELPDTFTAKIREMVQKGDSPERMFKFWERLQRNPSKRSVDQLFSFLGHCGIPIAEDGTFLAYKGVRTTYMDQHSNTIENKPGAVIKMPRNQISDDPRAACHEGLHVGALSYAQSFAALTLVVRVDPEHVVSVPYDENARKMRVCEYVVEGHYTVPLDNLTHDEDDFGLDDDLKDEETDTLSTDNKFELMDAEGTKTLLEHSIAELRAYATHHLKMVGASKIPGGKAKLVTKILKFRK